MKLQPFVPRYTESDKYILVPARLTLKLTIKVSLPWFLLHHTIYYIWFQIKKVQSITKGKKNTVSEESKQALEADSDIDTDFGTIKQKF